MPNFSFFWKHYLKYQVTLQFFSAKLDTLGTSGQNYCVHVFSWCIVPTYKCYLVLVVARWSIFGCDCRNPLYIPEQHRLIVADCTKNSNDN